MNDLSLHLDHIGDNADLATVLDHACEEEDRKYYTETDKGVLPMGCGVMYLGFGKKYEYSR
jgi:hypothetical protein